jgi:diguanylate cyclase (GGDEF)-like protein/PAS domain S-box-containing protein
MSEKEISKVPRPFKSNKNFIILLCCIICVQLFWTSTKLLIQISHNLPNAKLDIMLGLFALCILSIIVFNEMRKSRKIHKGLKKEKEEYIAQNKTLKGDLNRKDMLINTVTDVANILLGSTEDRIAFNRALERVGEAVLADGVHILKTHVKADDRKILLGKYGWRRENINEEGSHSQFVKLLSQEVTLDEIPWNEDIKLGEIVLKEYSKAHDEDKVAMEHCDIGALIIVPILLDKTFWGVMVFYDFNKERVWLETEIKVIASVAIGIKSAVKRREADKALDKALKYDFRQTAKSLQQIVFKLKSKQDGDMYYTLYEGKLADNLGRTTENMYGRNPLTGLPKEQIEHLSNYYEKAFKGEPCSYTNEDEGRIYHITLSPVLRNGEVKEVIGSAIDITEQKEAEKQIKYLAYYDQLTKMPNRVLFSNCLSSEIDRAASKNVSLPVMFLDIDRFKNINDTMGHVVGDEILKEVAKRLKEVIGGNGTIGRMGGDEFIIMLQEIGSEESVPAIAKSILDVFKVPIVIEEKEFFITVSLGISKYPSDGTTIDEIIKNAHTAMYRAKDIGRNNYQFYTLAMNEKAMETLILETELRRAVEKEELFLYYQPQVDIHSKKIVGCEALIRWQHPVRGIVPPGAFIPLAEDTGLIIPIGSWVLKTACKQGKRWHDAGYNDLRVSINISANQFQQNDFVNIVESTLKETGFNPHCLELEITENSIMQSTERTMDIMSKIKALGIRISIDDFGTGFSSLNYLRQFKADVLKIDRSFIKEVSSNASDAAITTAIINIAHSLNLTVIAEGVETQDQLNFLKNKNCNELQGYLISKPVPIIDFEDMLQRSDLDKYFA